MSFPHSLLSLELGFLFQGKKCRDFVGWCDGNVDESDLRPPPYKYPTCRCGAGVCRKVKETSGENEGRYFFACPVGGVRYLYDFCCFIISKFPVL